MNLTNVPGKRILTVNGSNFRPVSLHWFGHGPHSGYAKVAQSQLQLLKTLIRKAALAPTIKTAIRKHLPVLTGHTQWG